MTVIKEVYLNLNDKYLRMTGFARRAECTAKAIGAEGFRAVLTE